MCRMRRARTALEMAFWCALVPFGDSDHGSGISFSRYFLSCLLGRACMTEKPVPSDPLVI